MTNDQTNTVELLLHRVQKANEALVKGDFDSYIQIVRPTDDCRLMGPFGKSSQGYDLSPEGRARMARQFADGTFEQEQIQSYASTGLVVLVTIERINAEIAGTPNQSWALRVTQAFREDNGEWRLVHRHADPLVAGVSPEHGARLARGDLP